MIAVYIVLATIGGLMVGYGVGYLMGRADGASDALRALDKIMFGGPDE